MYGTIQVRLKSDDAVRDYLVYQCRQSNSLTNSAIYQIKQAHFEDCPRNEYFQGDEYRSGFKWQRIRTANYAELCLTMKDNCHYQALGGQAAQQTLKGEEVGINFVETEESYTSKTSFLDDDFLPKYGEKPESWKPSGKRGQRIKGKKFNLGRGGYQTADGTRINSDCNGAANILRKVAKQLGICLAKIGKGALNLPKRYDIFKGLKKSYRKRCVRVREASPPGEASPLGEVCLSAERRLRQQTT